MPGRKDKGHISSSTNKFFSTGMICMTNWAVAQLSSDSSQVTPGTTKTVPWIWGLMGIKLCL